MDVSGSSYIVQMRAFSLMSLSARRFLMGSRDNRREEKDGEVLWGEQRVTTGWENPASPNIYSGFYKPQLVI